MLYLEKLSRESKADFLINSYCYYCTAHYIAFFLFNNQHDLQSQVEGAVDWVM